jgi:glutaconate CoA-transferase, subunit B
LDEVYYREYLNAAKNEETYRTHLDHYIFNVSSHEEYLEKIGIKRLLGLSMN